MNESLLSVIVPACNEAASIEELFNRTASSLAGRKFEFILVDDGSTDDTASLVQRLKQEHPQIVYLRHFRNHGKSLALMQGFDAARGDVAVTMDADLQDEPEEIPKLLVGLREFDLVNGWRQKRQDAPSKLWASAIFNWLVGRVFGCRLHDINCGFKAMRRVVYKRLALRGDLHRLIPVLAATNGFRVGEIPVLHSPRKHGQSRYSLVRINGLLDIVTLLGANATQIRPFQVFAKAGMLFFALGMVALVGRAMLILGGAGSALRQLFLEFALMAGAWAVIVGTILPLFGFFLDVISWRPQDEEWRKRLLMETPVRIDKDE